MTFNGLFSAKALAKTIRVYSSPYGRTLPIKGTPETFTGDRAQYNAL